MVTWRHTAEYGAVTHPHTIRRPKSGKLDIRFTRYEHSRGMHDERVTHMHCTILNGTRCAVEANCTMPEQSITIRSLYAERHNFTCPDMPYL